MMSNIRMVLVWSQMGVEIDLSESFGHLELDQPVHAFVFPVSPSDTLGVTLPAWPKSPPQWIRPSF